MPKGSKGQKDFANLTFEEALRELEQRAALLEEEKLPLEEALKVVEETSHLAKICLEKLDQQVSL